MIQLIRGLLFASVLILAGCSTSKTKVSTMDLFDGQSLGHWLVTGFAGHGNVEVKDGTIQLGQGDPLTGITWTNAAAPLPKNNYEISLDAMKRQGSDFFCAVTFPVNDSFATMVLGGWGGSITGVSCINGVDASENETTKFIYFEPNRWYHVRIRLANNHLQGWVETDQVYDVDLEGKKISLRFGDIYLSSPLGVASFVTSSSIKNIKLQRL